jgi:bacteriocin-like protein
MSDFRELTANELNAVSGGCRTVDTRPIDADRVPVGPALASDPSTSDPGHPGIGNHVIKVTAAF